MAEGTKIIVGLKGDSAADVARQNGFVGDDAAYAAFLSQGAADALQYAQEAAQSRDDAQASAATAQAPTDAMNANLISTPGTETEVALGTVIDDRTTLFNELAVNVKRYGATGNGVTDDTAAIQAAEAVANDRYTRPLYFPNGTYLFSHTMTARVVQGESRQKTRLKYTGETNALDNGGTLAYHRRWESLTVVGAGLGVGLNLLSSPAGSYRNMIVEGFETGIYIDGGSSLYNVFDDVTVQSSGTGVKIDGLAHESRFINFRINFADIGVDIMGAGRTVMSSSSIENCNIGLVIRDRGTGRNVATAILSTRFEFNTTNIHIEPNVSKTALIGNHYIGGALIDEGLLTVLIDLNNASFEGSLLVALTARVDQVQARSSWDDARIQMTSAGATVDRNRAGTGRALRVNLVHPDATGNVFEAQRKSAVVARVTNEGHLALNAITPPPDIRIATGEAMFWVDTTNGAAKLMVSAKQADGTVVRGGIPLA